MRIIRPIEVTDAILTSSNVAETEHTEWSNATTYAIGDKVRVTDTGIHKVYESQIGSNLNNYPPDNLTGTTPAWLELSPTNRWGMFDDKVGTLTTNATSIAVDLEPGLGDSIAFLELTASSVDIVVTHTTDGEIYNRSFNLVSDVGVLDWYSYFYEPIVRKSSLATFDLPLYGGTTLSVTINEPDGTAKCGVLVIGRQRYFGRVRHGASLGTDDYSIKSTNEFGITSVVERGYARRATVEVLIEDSMVDVVEEVLPAYRAVPVVWSLADNSYSSALIYGYYQNYGTVVAYPTYSIVAIEIRGLT